MEEGRQHYVVTLALVLPATFHDDLWMVFMGFATLGTLVIDDSRPGETGVAGGTNTIGAVAAFGPTFPLTRRPTGRPVPEPAR